MAAPVLLSACAGALYPGKGEPRHDDAILILPGLGYSRAAEKALASTRAAFAAEQVDLYVAEYIHQEGLDASRDALMTFYTKHRLDRYKRVHVFSFIVGSWTVNPLLRDGRLPNVTTVMYDRSPYQERAPRIARDRLRIPAWIVRGSILFEVARTAYPPIDSVGRRIGIFIETRPTSFVRRFAGTAEGYGPFSFACNAMHQSYDDCAYVPYNHDELYTHFPEVVPEVLSFIRTGRFSDQALRASPVADSLRVPRGK